jgi:hypothetical protein
VAPSLEWAQHFRASQGKNDTSPAFDDKALAEILKDIATELSVDCDNPLISEDVSVSSRARVLFKLRLAAEGVKNQPSSHDRSASACSAASHTS